MVKFKDVKDEFWNQFGDKDSDFENEVRKGIWVRVIDASVLPEPPEGYYWAQDSSEIIQGQKIKYRLWNDQLGYMPVFK
jgi:hypothetical protein